MTNIYLSIKSQLCAFYSTGIFKCSLINSCSTQCGYLNSAARQPSAVPLKWHVQKITEPSYRT